MAMMEPRLPAAAGFVMGEATVSWAGGGALFRARRKNLELALVITQPTSRPWAFCGVR
jgi:hypothetical protein